MTHLSIILLLPTGKVRRSDSRARLVIVNFRWGCVSTSFRTRLITFNRSMSFAFAQWERRASSPLLLGRSVRATTFLANISMSAVRIILRIWIWSSASDTIPVIPTWSTAMRTSISRGRSWSWSWLWPVAPFVSSIVLSRGRRPA